MMGKTKEIVPFILVRLVCLIIATAVYAVGNYYLLIIAFLAGVFIVPLMIIAAAIYAFASFNLRRIALLIAFLTLAFIVWGTDDMFALVIIYGIVVAANIGLSYCHNLVKHGFGTEKSWTDLYPIFGMIALIIYHYYENHTGVFSSSDFITFYSLCIGIYLLFLAIKYAFLYDDGKKDIDKPDPPRM